MDAKVYVMVNPRIAEVDFEEPSAPFLRFTLIQILSFRDGEFDRFDANQESEDDHSVRSFCWEEQHPERLPRASYFERNSPLSWINRYYQQHPNIQ